jgi:hypothetical protein
MCEKRMYEKPKLERFGTFRELTRIGLGPDGDGGIFGYLDGPPPPQPGDGGRS